MSQIRCFLMLLSMILGMACIVECRSTLFNSRYDSPVEESQADKNSPRRHESCYYPYRSNKPERCDYSILFGNYSKGDELVWNKEYPKPSSIFTPLVVQVEFPEGKATNEYEIRYIYVEDSKQSKQIWEDELHISKGGIGEKYVSIIIETESRNYNNPFGHYRVAIYGRRSTYNE